MYGVPSPAFDDWVACDLGRNEVAFWATRFVSYRLASKTLTSQIDHQLQARFPEETWILNTDGLTDLARRVCTYALNTVHEVGYDSFDLLDESYETFPLSLVEKWYPERDDVPPERFTTVSLSADSDDGHDTFLDLDGNVCEPDCV